MSCISSTNALCMYENIKTKNISSTSALYMYENVKTKKIFDFYACVYTTFPMVGYRKQIIRIKKNMQIEMCE